MPCIDNFFNILKSTLVLITLTSLIEGTLWALILVFIDFWIYFIRDTSVVTRTSISLLLNQIWQYPFALLHISVKTISHIFSCQQIFNKFVHTFFVLQNITLIIPNFNSQSGGQDPRFLSVVWLQNNIDIEILEFLDWRQYLKTLNYWKFLTHENIN